MFTKKTIAIIGAATNEGQAMAGLFLNSNCRLLLYDTDMLAVQILAQRILAQQPNADVEAHPCPIDSSWEADIIVLATPPQNVPGVIEKIKDVANQKTVIDIRQYNNAHESSIAKALPHSKIVTATMEHAQIVNLQSDDKEALRNILLLMPEINWKYSNA